MLNELNMKNNILGALIIITGFLTIVTMRDDIVIAMTLAILELVSFITLLWVNHKEVIVPNDVEDHKLNVNVIAIMFMFYFNVAIGIGFFVVARFGIWFGEWLR